MKLSYTLFKLFLIFSLLMFSQQTPIDFSSSNHNFTTFSNSGFAFNVNPQDPSDDVGQFFNDGSENWQGFYIDLVEPLDLDTQNQITLSFYQFDPNNHAITIKLENGTNPDVEVVQNNSGSGWSNDMVFDFSSAILSGVGTNINATGSYSRMTVFIDGGIALSGTYLIDDINDGSAAVDSNALDIIYSDLVWSDEFDTNGVLDSNKWFHQTQLPSGGNWFNGEEQHYTNRIENSYVDNGFLNIVAIKENFTDQGETKQYTSARLNSKFAFTHGRVDVRARLPEGDGTWPAIWTLGKNINEAGAYWQTQGFGTTGWPACGEIDIMEHGLGATNHVSSALHTPSSFGNTMNFQSYTLNDVANEFHIYSVNWSPNQITFLIDNVGFYTYNPAVKDSSTWPFDNDQYLLLNIAMGGVSGTIDPNFTQSSMVIDYVRVYQNSVLGIDDEFANKFSVYPNPVNSFINIKSEELVDSIELFNSIGQLVKENRKENINQINVEDLEIGFYVLKIYSGNSTIIKKVIIN
ncbi:family 16 glycosylhydrolase [Winogradskyella sp. PG-2]|uniref:family 16 glycosylhydrolase n=1 Tax=Winogradskyella sp. PG-2 TaxID=754409 RepID=UPI0004588461|nr:family 16 glycosylhydrolase [Winogradskyella sp. PG-2]BAO76967.1 beta-glucanase precursor [Winogradskyella sp. PG-2]